MLKKTTLTLVFLVLASTASAAGLFGHDPERGWFFFQQNQPAKTASAPVKATAQSPQEQAQTPAPSCSDPKDWNPSCGFVDPGTNFAFQSEERDQLLNRMAVSNNDPKAVEAFQRYMHWALQRTAQVTNLWWYNMAQHPELDPTVSQPVTEFGLRLMSEVKNDQYSSIFHLVKQSGGIFVVFSKASCQYCHQMVPTFQRLQRFTGIPVRNASIDGPCLEELTKDCSTGKQVLLSAEALHVKVVPSVFLYVKPNTWLRLSTGISSVDAIEARAIQFFSAYRTALLKGVHNNQGLGQASVDFSGGGANGNGNSEVQAGSPSEPLPSKSDIAHLLGM